MSKVLIFATTTISFALVFYTIGVWSERKAKELKKWHVITFWLGLFFDITGTLTMERIANSGVASISVVSSGIHGITGVLAILLMAFHVIWATLVLIKNDRMKKQTFHRFSLVVWMIWLIPYFIGMGIGIMK
ncbi:MAG TPA: HsmA family protein [Anaerovoracaceae bacterium]|nr:HsmA family protein [Anaerovoracaceae bacterium]